MNSDAIRSSLSTFSIRNRTISGLAGLTILALAALPLARADLSVARGSLSLTAVLDEEYDSNIFLNQFRTSDWHTTFTPGLKFVRDAGLIRLDTNAGVAFQRFQRYDTENSSDPFADASLRWTQEESNVDSRVSATYRRASQANIDVNTRTRAEDLGGRIFFGHFPAEKLGYHLNAGYNNQNFLLDGMSDIRTRDVSGDVRYHYSTKLDAFVGVGKRWSDTYHVPVFLNSFDSEDVSLKVGVEGEILPKVTGQLAAGWVRRSFKNVLGGSQSGALLDTSLTWRPDDEMSVRLLANRDFDTTPVDQSVMRQVTGIETHRQIREKLGITLGYSHAVSRYIGVGVSRRDSSNIYLLGADYQLTKTWKAGVHANYAATDSNVVVSDYNHFVGGANVSVQF